MKCNKCGSDVKDGARFWRECGTTLSVNMTNTSKVLEKTKTKKDGGLVALIVILIVVLLGSGGTIFWVYHINQNVDVDSSNILNEPSNKTIEIDENDDTLVNGEEKDEPSDLGEDMGLDTEKFSYTFNQANINASPTYKRVDNSEYSYYCAVHNHFVEDVVGEVYRITQL